MTPIAAMLLKNLMRGIDQWHSLTSKTKGDRVELDPEAATLQLCYRIPLRSGVSVASPGGLGAIPTLIFKSLARVA
jgi:hypothetical protein